MEIFELRPLIANFSCKLSTISSNSQLLCCVNQDNEILLRYTNVNPSKDTREGFKLKLISWFRRTNRIVHDCCFDPSGTWLLVLCFDNTLHIIPALAIVDPPTVNSSPAQQTPFSTTQVTSYIIPFVGPHECPDSKKCPNQNIESIRKNENISTTERGTVDLSENLQKLELDEKENKDKESLEDKVVEDSRDVLTFSHDPPANMLAGENQLLTPTENIDKTGNSQVLANSFMASSTCPYPLSVMWWQTMDGLNRAIIGYSDGSICFVGLSPNCPFVASTAIETGSVVKLLICKDNTFESVMLMITSSLKVQYKLLLEQKAIRYVYPGDISPSSTQARESDWQIVMSLKQAKNQQNNNSPEATSDDEIFTTKNEQAPSTVSCDMLPPTRPPPPSFSQAQASQATIGVQYQTNIATTRANYHTSNQMPPPPPYSVAINRHMESAPITTMAGSLAAETSGGANTIESGTRFQQQSGILPAARARLSSLKSLGSKKLTAIKMRLYDNRQKLEEYIPGNVGNSFAILDSPSLTPELLCHSNGSFFTLQNLRSTYLISALHSQSSTLTVHAIDVNLRPLFFYKIPRNCLDILISSNILYSIQYVDIKRDDAVLTKVAADLDVAGKQESNTDKENRDTDIEKQDNYADSKVLDDDFDLGDKPDVSKQGNESVDTSATTSGSSSSANETATPSNMVNAVGVISSAMASCAGHEMRNKPEALLTLFRFEHETVLSLHQMATCRVQVNETISKDEKAKAFAYKDIRSPIDYVQFYTNAVDKEDEFSLRQWEIMQNEFPKINYDPCYVITDKNVYFIQLKKEPFAIFLDAALASDWKQCRDFCNIFDLSYETCIEFAGDYLLRRNKVTQALLTYNSARVKPIRTALKLAMFGHTCALMHLCAMALKITYVLKSQHFCSPMIKTMLNDITYRHSEDVRKILPKTAAARAKEGNINEGASCSDYTYGVDELLSSLQMSPSSQFHLANLLLITLAEKAVNDKNYIPLWNFLAVNSKYHTNMTSIVLCQSGLFSSALLLAKVRGVWIDAFVALTSVVAQEFGWYTEFNVCLYNLSELTFAQTLLFIPQVAVDYFGFIQEKMHQIRFCVLKRLEKQLNPFSATLRPIVSHTSSAFTHYNSNDNNALVFDFCRTLIETYLAILVHMESQQSKRGRITNALSTFRITYEDNQFAIESSRFKPISAGCANCACVLDGIAYFWGSNGVPCSYSVNKISDPPEPPHAVKCLDFLSQLNLEVHTVKCGRQHILVLTNNGLYAFGNNYQLQLGIGRHIQVSLTPMLVEALDGKNVTILEAGQYHNAALADGLLYTWGWGVYGQLGHGDCENVETPKLVSFFKFKKILQVSLGHAHSLVLCQAVNANCTDLFVFGSNHFGQLGIGTNDPSNSDEFICANQVKSSLPIKLDVSTSRLRLIHTKFFTNLAVDDNEKMYTWGSSPQALRLANQMKRRANAKQKLEEQQRREISKQFEATFTQQTSFTVDGGNNASATSTSTLPSTSTIITQAQIVTQTTEFIVEARKETEIESVAQKSPAQNPSNTLTITELASNVDEDLNENEENEEESKNKNNAKSTNEAILTTDMLAEDNSASTVTVEDVDDESEMSGAKKAIATPVSLKIEVLENVTEEIVPTVEPMMAQPLKPIVQEPASESDSEPEADAAASQKKIETDEQKTLVNEVDPCEHMTPHLVDTSEIAGQIIQLSSGLFHFALISSTCTLYTWGKNLEHQLGTEDKERRAVNKPMPLDNIESPMYVDCGADFTVVMTTDYVVKAFGGNANGQCGRDLGPSLDKMKQRVVCLPTTKRLMRFESQCVEIPVEINLPRPSIRLNTVRYLKSIPHFRAHFVQEADINFHDVLNCAEPRSTSSQQYNLTSDNTVTGQESDDMISSLENLSNNEILDNYNAAIAAFGVDSCTASNDNSSYELTPEDHSYARLATTADQMNQPVTTHQMNAGTRLLPNAASNRMEASPRSTLTSASDDISTGESSIEDLQQLRHFIHYCLYIFHGLYNPERVCEFAKNRLEYRVRVRMLNFKFVDAFQLCLDDCETSHKALKIFEYFSKDTSFVPMRRQDLKYLIYYLLRHFLERKLDVLECERFFLADLEFYLMELAYVLYFNNNNTILEQNLNQKFKNLFTQDESQQHQQQQQCEQYKLDDAVIHVIFDSLSVKFKTIVCQKLLKHCSSNN